MFQDLEGLLIAVNLTLTNRCEVYCLCFGLISIAAVGRMNLDLVKRTIV